jgi:hypothetical protein
MRRLYGHPKQYRIAAPMKGPLESHAADLLCLAAQKPLDVLRVRSQIGGC